MKNQNNNTNKNKMSDKTNACGEKGCKGSSKNSMKNCGNNSKGGEDIFKIINGGPNTNKKGDFRKKATF